MTWHLLFVVFLTYRNLTFEDIDTVELAPNSVTQILNDHLTPNGLMTSPFGPSTVPHRSSTLSSSSSFSTSSSSSSLPSYSNAPSHSSLPLPLPPSFKTSSSPSSSSPSLSTSSSSSSSKNLLISNNKADRRLRSRKFEPECSLTSEVLIFLNYTYFP